MVAMSTDAPTPDPIRVFVCDDASEYRALLRYELEDDPGLTVVGEASNGDEGVEGVAQTKPDVVVCDLSMPICDGLEAIPRMREIAPDLPIIALSGLSREAMEDRALRAGALCYIEKSDPPDVIRAALHDAVARRSQPG